MNRLEIDALWHEGDARAWHEAKVELDDLFALAEFEPNDSQCRTSLNEKKPLFLVAGPGSGKLGF